MKVALVYGKGLDGCGVQRTGVEMQRWAETTGEAQVDIYSLVERYFTRSGGHSMPKPPRNFKPEDCARVARELNEYDVVIVQSYPSFKHSPAAILSFYRDVMLRLEKPVVVGMVHEIIQTNVDRIPLIIPLLNACDVVCNFSTKTTMARLISSALPSKALGGRTRRFRMWACVDDVIARTRETERARRMIYVGRWTTMKDPMRVLDLQPVMRERDASFQLALHGIEKSVGSRVDVLAHPLCRFMRHPGNSRAFFNRYDWDGTLIDASDAYLFRTLSPSMLPNVQKRLIEEWGRGAGNVPQEQKVQVFGPYTYDQGIGLLGESMFGCSFYRLPREPHNYGDRMEYTQIEIAAAGCVPVFDAHYGQNNLTEDGRRYCDVDGLAVWSSKDDLAGTADQLLCIADRPKLRRRFVESARAFVRSEFNATTICPEMLADFARLGKDQRKMGQAELMEHLFGTSDAARDMERLLSDGAIPAVGFAEARDKKLKRFQGHLEGSHKLGLAGAQRLEVSDYSSAGAGSLEELFA